MTEHERKGLQIGYRRANGYSVPYRYASERRSRINKTGRNRDLFVLAPYLCEEKQRAPLSLMLVNTHVLTEIVVATECLITTRERTQKSWLQGMNQHPPSRSGDMEKKVKLTLFVGMDASNVTLEVFTPGETLPAIGHDTDEGPSGSMNAVRTDRVWGRRDAPSAALLRQIGNRDRTGLPATTFRRERYRDSQMTPRLVGRS